MIEFGWTFVVFMCSTSVLLLAIAYAILIGRAWEERTVEYICEDCGEHATDCDYMELHDSRYLMCRRCRREFARLKYERTMTLKAKTDLTK